MFNSAWRTTHTWITAMQLRATAARDSQRIAYWFMWILRARTRTWLTRGLRMCPFLARAMTHKYIQMTQLVSARPSAEKFRNRALWMPRRMPTRTEARNTPMKSGTARKSPHILEWRASRQADTPMKSSAPHMSPNLLRWNGSRRRKGSRGRNTARDFERQTRDQQCRARISAWTLSIVSEPARTCSQIPLMYRDPRLVLL